MLRNKKFLSLLGILTFFIFFTFSSQIFNQLDFDINLDKQNEKLENNNEITIEQRIKSSTSWNVQFIHISNDNWSQNEIEWIQNKTGTWNDPHIIENVTINGGGSIKIENSNEYFIIRNCTVYNSGGTNAGILLDNTNNGSIIENNASLNYHGIYLKGDCSFNNITDNIANNNLWNGINIDTCYNNTISSNSVKYNDDHGISLTESSYNNISENIAYKNGGTGIYVVTNSHYNKIIGNTAQNNDHRGIHIAYNANFNNISQNLVIDNADYGGIEIESCHHITVDNNFVDSNYRGITAHYTGGNCDNSYFYENLIKDNLHEGLLLESACDDNFIYKNAFINNSKHAEDSGSNNHWNSTDIGNYWDNHTISDADHDGIVDTTYTWIFGSAGSIDNFPLAESPLHVGGTIHIDDDGSSAPAWDRTAELNNWVTGSGTLNDPYVIEGLDINGDNLSSCISIEDSSVYFTIRDCTLYNASTSGAGIYLDQANNGKMTNNNCSLNNGVGIYLTNSDKNNITGNTVTNNTDRGIDLSSSDDNIISNNTVINNGVYGIYLYLTSYNNNFTENIIKKHTWAGIEISQSYKCKISGNKLSENHYGVSLFWADNTSVLANIINDNNKQGIRIDFTNGSIIRGNILNSNQFGAFGILADSITNNFSWNAIDREIDPVIIDESGLGNFTWTEAVSDLAWCTGSGSWGDPYLLQNLIINGQNSNDCLKIKDSTKPFIVRNCIFYNASDNVGLYLSNAHNGRILNNNCSFASMGMVMVNSNNNTIIENTFINNTYGGFNANHVQNNTISGNVIYNNGLYGIAIYWSSNNNTISNNNIYNNYLDGIYLINSYNHTIIGNNLTDNMENGIYLENCTHTKIINNDLINNAKNGIYLKYSNYTNIINNYAHHNNDIGIFLVENCNYNFINNNSLTNFLHGISIKHSENNTVINNEVSLCGRGLNLEYNFNNTVVNNYVHDNTYTGILISYSHNHSVLDNEVYNNGHGILVMYSNYTIVRNNTANENGIGIYLYNEAYFSEIINNTANQNNEHGIYLIDSDYNNISLNTANNNIKNGIYLSNSHFNNVTNNTANNNGECGIELNPSNYNTITGNTLKGNPTGLSVNPSCLYNIIGLNDIQDLPGGSSSLPASGGDDDNDGELSSIFSGHYLLLLSILIISLAVMGLLAGKTVGDMYNRLRLHREAGAEEILVGVPKIAKTLDLRKDELALMEKRLSEIEVLRDTRIAQIQIKIEKNEKRLMEERLQQRLELQEEYYTSFNSLEELKNELGAEISRRTELEQDINDLEKKKQNIENSITQLQLKHETDLRQIREQTRIEEKEWAQRRAKMKQDIELEWQNKIREMEEERSLAQNDLENQIKVEEERRIQLQKKSSFNDERLKIIEAIKELEEGLLDNIETRLKDSEDFYRKIADEINAFPEINTTPEIVNLNALILTEIGNVISLLESQRNKENISDGIISKLSRIDAHIRSLSSKIEMQRAAPVLTLPPSQRKGRFSIFNEIEFLCELCHKSMFTVEVKERRLWAKWALLGAKSIMNLSKLGFLVDVIVKKPAIELKKEEFADEFKEGRLTDLVSAIQQGDLDLSEDLMSFAKEIKTESEIEVRKMGGYEEIIIKFNRYFNNVIKKGYTFEELLNIFSSKEKVLWQLYSQDEQETIRTFLKNSGNATLYMADLQLRHGLFVCEECRSWIDGLEEKRNTPGGETNLGK